MQRTPKVGDTTLWVIYALRDPRTYDIRYVGFSVNVNSRLSQHLDEALGGGRTHKCCWLRLLLRDGLFPDLVILESGVGFGWSIRERHWIKTFRDLGERLTNLTDGGEGMMGYHHSEETRKKISELNRGRVPSLGMRRKVSEKLTGRKKPDSVVESLRRRPCKPETRAKVGLCHRNKVVSNETRMKQSKSQKQRFLNEPERSKQKAICANAVRLRWSRHGSQNT